jgi:hypothetical protein
MLLRRIFGPKRGEVTAWSKLHNEELHNMYLSSNIIRQIKSRGIMLAGNIARMGRSGKCTRFWWESPKERDHSEDRGVDGSMGLEWFLGRLDGEC